MKKNSIIKGCVAISVAVVSLVSCNNSQPQTEKKTDKSDVSAASAGQKIAFIEVDSIMSQYKFCKEYSEILQKKSQNIQNTLSSKQQQLQNAIANFQQKVQQNAYTREQAESIQANLQRQGNDLANLEQRLSGEFQAENAKFDKALHDSIQHFLTAYNKDKKYAMILAKAGDNILYADKQYDITNEVVAGLNKAYKSTVAKTPAPKEKAKK